MRILLTGADGQLGTTFRQTLAAETLIPLTRTELDITDRITVEKTVAEHQPDWILNCAAYNLVDEAEDNVEITFRVNTFGVLHLARAAETAGAVLVHFSTDYVFSGEQNTPYTEHDAPGPLSVYALSKLAGERMARRYTARHFVIRTCELYGAERKTQGGSFVDRMLRAAREGKPLRVVNDQVLTPTNVHELARKTVRLVQSGRYGLYHMTNTGECSWFEFIQEALHWASIHSEIQPTTHAALGTKGSRPAYSVLDNRALREAGLEDFRRWQDALREYLEGQRV